jgi:YggT family protein
MGTIDLSPLVALILLRIAIELVTTIVASLL